MRNPGYFPTEEEFRTLARSHNVVPVSRDILADTETPVSAFMKIDNGRDAFLLESVEGGENWGRYSFLGVSPRAIIRSKNGTVEIIEGENIVVKKGNPIEILRSYLSMYRAAPLKGGERFSGGAIGYMSYDMARYMEALPDIAKKDLDLHELYFIVTDTLLIFDSMEHKIKVVANEFIEEGKNPVDAYKRAVSKIEGVISMLKTCCARTPESDKSERVPRKPTDVKSNFPKADFMRAVERVKGYIEAGDIIQAVISQRFSAKLTSDPFDVYRALRITNPSPYMFFLRFDKAALAGSSPEILVRVEDSLVTVRPIAGTRPRGKDDSEDRRFEEELLGDPKERAEHIMLVDLGRNDVGRVSVGGSVKVDELMAIERYSHVMHIVSNVRGVKKDDSDSFDVLSACFPAGTLTGAPKIRAMEIIEEIEPCKRGVYGGCVGYIGFSGNMDVGITIRTVLIKDDTVYVQAGAGIVADSIPEKEYEETINKAKGVLKAVEMAAEGLD